MVPIYEYDRLNKSKPLMRIPFVQAIQVLVTLPLGGFLFCVFWSLIFEFESSTSTHCEVRNYLPSLSTAIGNYEPQRTVWRWAISLQFPARIAISKMYIQYYRNTIQQNRHCLALVACALNVIENFALLSLSVWTSLEDYPIHRNSFGVFMACSEIYMLMSYFLNKNSRRIALLPIEAKALKYKRNLFIVNVMSFFMAAYCFLRHNSFCEPGVYTLFALFEYIVVLTNMGYHMTACWDFHKMHVTCDWERWIYLS